ncbi:hypothetical protein L6164_011952 [Bauhinia variegata]|uniref:Uncharacterized protein n=1 Tax=Bauhinia variegata TaxID=167791 RepID=A0ACB9PBE7_BAUVA|nr:hypothetical protein L6164_011952 [Bauhinia variegata]
MLFSGVGSGVPSLLRKGTIHSWEFAFPFLLEDKRSVAITITIDIVTREEGKKRLLIIFVEVRVQGFSFRRQFGSCGSPNYVCNKRGEVVLISGSGMDYKRIRDKDTELDLESGLAVHDDSNKASTSGTAKQGMTLFPKVSSGFAGGSRKEDMPSSYSDESNLGGVSVVDVANVTNNSSPGDDSVDRNVLLKEKRKKKSNKKAPKPPRPPRAPSLDAADMKLIKEMSEVATLKRARIERMKALKKMKAANTSSSPSASIFAMIFTIVFCIVIILQGMWSGKTSVASFQGSPVAAGGTEGGLISVQYNLNPSSSDRDAPRSESPNFVQRHWFRTAWKD